MAVKVPDEEVFRFWIDEIRGVGVHLLGRRLYETMLYWETAAGLAYRIQTSDDGSSWTDRVRYPTAHSPATTSGCPA